MIELFRRMLEYLIQYPFDWTPSRKICVSCLGVDYLSFSLSISSFNSINRVVLADDRGSVIYRLSTGDRSIISFIPCECFNSINRVVSVDDRGSVMMTASSIAFRPGTGRLFLLGRANASDLFHLCQIRASVQSLFRLMVGDPSSIAIRPGTSRVFLLGRVNASIRSIELFWPMIGDPSSIANRMVDSFF